MLKIMIFCFAICGLLAGFGAYLIASYATSRATAPATRTRSPVVVGGIAFVVVWASLSLGFLHWISRLP